MGLVKEKKVSQKRHKKKWVRVSPDEMIYKYSDILRAYWHDGPVEPILDRFFRNVHTGKIKIKKKDFNTFKLKISTFLPEYRHRDRKESVLQRLYGLVATYERGMPFYYSCKKFLYKFWPIIKNTKDDVIVGLVASIIALIDTKYDKTKFSVNTICAELGIRPSTIHSQVKNKIFEQYNLPEFDTLVKSRTILREFLVKIGLSEENAIEDIKLSGTALQTFNFYDTNEYYFYILKDMSEYPVFVCLKPLQDEMNCNTSRLTQKNSFELIFWWFEQPKGPPST